MALSKSLSLLDNFGELILFPNSYIKVTTATATKEICEVSVDILKEKNSQVLCQRLVSFLLDLDGPNPIKQAYLHLKSLPEFADAVDC
jgi:hypothetical protein